MSEEFLTPELMESLRITLRTLTRIWQKMQHWAHALPDHDAISIAVLYDRSTGISLFGKRRYYRLLAGGRRKHRVPPQRSHRRLAVQQKRRTLGLDHAGHLLRDAAYEAGYLHLFAIRGSRRYVTKQLNSFRKSCRLSLVRGHAWDMRRLERAACTDARRKKQRA